MKDLFKLGIFLAIACAIAAAALSITYVITSPVIESQKLIKVQQAIAKDCLPGCSNIKQAKNYYIGYDKRGNIFGYAFLVSPKGYGGAIDMIVGIDTKGSVSGVKILAMKETPGLGLKAGEFSFLKQFIGKTSKDPLIAKKDIDAITGATITSQAVSDGVKEALNLYQSLP